MSQPLNANLPLPDVLTVYGASWCGDCRRTQRYLDGAGVPYRYVDLRADPAAQRLLDEAGYRAIPVVLTVGGAVLIEPSDQELAAALAAEAA